MQAHKIINEDKIDLLITYMDALEILTNSDEDEIIFSEFTPTYPIPAYVKAAAHRGLKKTLLGDDSPLVINAKKLVSGDEMSIRSIRNLRKHASNALEQTTFSEKGDELLLRGVSPSKTALSRTISWCNARIKHAEAA